MSLLISGVLRKPSGMGKQVENNKDKRVPPVRREKKIVDLFGQ